jgi:dephospho-CoA kinase
LFLKVIGLTGGIGSGKSAVARFLAALGAAVVDLDKVGHGVLKKGSRASRLVAEAFGEQILAPGGEIDRATLGKIVFNDRAALLRLNAIVHPAIDAVVARKIAAFRERGVNVVVLEAAVMIDTGRTDMVDELWVATAPQKLVLSRLKARSGYSEKESRERIKSQVADEERLKHADVVITNDGTLDELKAKVIREWRKLQERI